MSKTREQGGKTPVPRNAKSQLAVFMFTEILEANDEGRYYITMLDHAGVMTCYDTQRLGITALAKQISLRGIHPLSYLVGHTASTNNAIPQQW